VGSVGRLAALRLLCALVFGITSGETLFAGRAAEESLIGGGAGFVWGRGRGAATRSAESKVVVVTEEVWCLSMIFRRLIVRQMRHGTPGLYTRLRRVSGWRVCERCGGTLKSTLEKDRIRGRRRDYGVRAVRTAGSARRRRAAGGLLKQREWQRQWQCQWQTPVARAVCAGGRRKYIRQRLVGGPGPCYRSPPRHCVVVPSGARPQSRLASARARDQR